VRKEYNLSFAERQRRREAMQKLNSDPVFAEARAKYASQRMKAIHALAKKAAA